MKPLLTALDIDVGYTQCQQQQRLLTQFNFTLAPHEIVTLLGPSGVGKSSLLKVLAGLSPPLAGTVYYQGVPLTGPHPQHSVALHAPCLLPWLSLEKNVAFGLDFKCQQPLSRSQQQARIDCAIHAVGLERHRRKMPAQLSGGMAQRAVLARCLARLPTILFLDEPFAALDEITRNDMQHLLLSIIQEQQTAAVMITHDIDEALLISDRIILLGGQPGRIIGEWVLDFPHPRDELLDELGALRIAILKTLRDERDALTSNRGNYYVP